MNIEFKINNNYLLYILMIIILEIIIKKLNINALKIDDIHEKIF